MLTVTFWHFSLPVVYLIILSAFFASFITATIATRKSKQPLANALFDVFWWSILAARIAFVVHYFDHYRQHWLDIIDIRDGGFYWQIGALVAALALAYHYIRHQPLRRPMLPSIAVGLCVGLFAFVFFQPNTSDKPTIPAIEFTHLKGTPINLAEMPAGRPMVVNLWASWCPPCIREMPVLADAQRAHPEIEFVFVNQGESKEAVETFLKQFPTIDNILLDNTHQLAAAVDSNGLPTTIFYNAQGQRVHAHVGGLSTATLARGLDYFSTDKEQRQ